ncbi:MAG: hypothetical protein K2N48_06605 [Muribaculaceae bacterium]|nr:hypothetical protein [Muribaculaceae bacterium]
MKMIRLIAGSVLMACMAVLFTGCRPHEERVMDRLDRLSEKIQKNGEKWGVNEWADALEELEDIHYDMEDCEFSSEQLRALGRVEGKLTVIIMTEGAKKLGNELIPFLEGAGAFMKGYKEGTESMEDYGLDELEKYGNHLNQELERINEELDLDGNKDD